MCDSAWFTMLYLKKGYHKMNLDTSFCIYGFYNAIKTKLMEILALGYENSWSCL